MSYITLRLKKYSSYKFKNIISKILNEFNINDGFDLIRTLLILFFALYVLFCTAMVM